MRYMKRVGSVLLAGVLAASMAIGFSGCSTASGKTIYVIAKGESHAFWQSVKAGAVDAAEKYGYTVDFKGPASESASELSRQLEMVQAAISNNASGIVLGTIGKGFVDQLKQAKEKGIPVVQFDSGVWQADLDALNEQNQNPIVSSVATSNRNAAALAAEKFFEAIKADIAASTDGYIVGVIQHDETQTGNDRAGGFMDKFKELADADSTTNGKYTIQLEVKPDDTQQNYKTALEALTEKGAKAIFMCNEGVVKQVYDAVSTAGDKYNSMKFCGFDAGSKQIEWMKAESGPKLVGSVAQDSYQIGYQAVEQVINAIEGKEVTENVGIDGAWWDATNVDEMIEKNLVYTG